MKTKRKSQLKRKNNIWSIIINGINWDIVFGVLVAIVVLLIFAGFFIFAWIFPRWLMDNFGMSEKEATTVILIIFAIIWGIFAIICASIRLVRFITLCARISTLPLTKDEFEITTDGMTLSECVQFFDEFISYRTVTGNKKYYLGFISGDHSETLFTLLCLIYEKYKDLDNEKISEIRGIIDEELFAYNLENNSDFANRYSIDNHDDYNDLQRIQILIRNL